MYFYHSEEFINGPLQEMIFNKASHYESELLNPVKLTAEKKEKKTDIGYLSEVLRAIAHLYRAPHSHPEVKKQACTHIETILKAFVASQKSRNYASTQHRETGDMIADIFASSGQIPLISKLKKEFYFLEQQLKLPGAMNFRHFSSYEKLLKAALDGRLKSNAVIWSLLHGFLMRADSLMKASAVATNWFLKLATHKPVNLFSVQSVKDRFVEMYQPLLDQEIEKLRRSIHSVNYDANLTPWEFYDTYTKRQYRKLFNLTLYIDNAAELDFLPLPVHHLKVLVDAGDILVKRMLVEYEREFGERYQSLRDLNRTVASGKHRFLIDILAQLVMVFTKQIENLVPDDKSAEVTRAMMKKIVKA